ncbi:MAG: DUF262 domain-containing protein, partial [Bacteroidales bacterium]|nr:DUF262 domain-containing protein [Bacteroidales bacterium]
MTYLRHTDWFIGHCSELFCKVRLSNQSFSLTTSGVSFLRTTGATFAPDGGGQFRAGFRGSHARGFSTNIQRGLVWKPRQIELLWDSILRGFPIGTFTVMLKDGADETGELIDGQQRRDAILAAFKEPSTDSQSVVWIDLGFDKNLVPDRKFGIRVTTKAHPWGYYLDGSTLSAEERRRAIEQANETPGTSKSLWNILNFGPSVQVDLPVPLYYLL